MVAFMYGYSIQQQVQKKRLVLLDDVDALHMSNEKEDADYNVSSNTASEKMTEKEVYNIATNVWPDYSIDGPNRKD